LTTTGTPEQWVTISEQVGSGTLVYTTTGRKPISWQCCNPGANSEAAQFLNNVVTLAYAPFQNHRQ